MNFSKQGPDSKPAWTRKSVKILSAFADTGQAPNLTEGIKLLAGEQSAQVKAVDVSEWRRDKLGKWSNEAQELLFKIAQGHFDVVWLTMPTKGMARSLFTNAEGPAAQRHRLYPYGFPWLTQQGKRAAVAVTVTAATLFVLAFEAMTQKGTGMVLTTSEERGEAQRGEPRSWWQAAETKHLATIGGNQERIHMWSRTKVETRQNNKPRSDGHHDKLSVLQQLVVRMAQVQRHKERIHRTIAETMQLWQRSQSRKTRSNKEDSNTCSDMCRNIVGTATTSRRTWELAKFAGLEEELHAHICKQYGEMPICERLAD